MKLEERRRRGKGGKQLVEGGVVGIYGADGQLSHCTHFTHQQQVIYRINARRGDYE